MQEQIYEVKRVSGTKSIDLRVSKEFKDVGIVNEYKSISREEYLNNITSDDFKMIEESSEFFMQEDAKTISEVKNYIVL